ncbi:MAG: patatin-like phospholipase family protein [Lachnospiraceae bacterium]|nr:patatin-like phospholipase family protein [Lachnospiraceae bacterium]
MINKQKREAFMTIRGNMKADKVGLVFSGGGTCGAYQIGFWKALKEFGGEENIVALSGSSVGSLNALLYAYGDLELAVDIWNSLSQADMVRLRPFLDGKGVFSQIGYSRLIDMIEDGWDQMQRGMPIYCCVTVMEKGERIDLLHMEAGRPEYILLNPLKYNKMKNTVLASSAVPYIYSRRHVNGMECVDGDFSDKTPYIPLINSGCDVVIILHLNTREEALHRRLESDEDHIPGTDIKLLHLYPAKTLGNFMSVSKTLTADRMKRGYEEGKAFLLENGKAGE